MTPLRYLDAADHAAVTALARTVAEHDGVEGLTEATLLHAASGEQGDYRFVLVREQPDNPDSPLVAAAHVDLPSEDAASVEIVVAPSHRRNGLGEKLAWFVLERFPEARFWAHGYLPGAKALGEKLGLDVVRELWQMSRPAEGISPACPDEVEVPEGFTWRTFDPGSDKDARDWLTVNAAAFAYHPEQGRMTRSDLQARMSEPWFDAGGFFLVHEKGDPNAPAAETADEVHPDSAPSTDGARPGEGRLAAFHWTKIPEPVDLDAPADQRGPGEVYVVGVHPDLQGHGLGRVATDLGLAHLASTGVSRVDLYVEGDNTAAIATYRRAGFERSALDVQLGRTDTESAPQADAADTDEEPSPAEASSHSPGADSPAATDTADHDDETGISTAADQPSGSRSGRRRRRRVPHSRFVALDQPGSAQMEFPHDRFLDRELSWLAFNERVMQMAEDRSVPLLERVNFVSIFASNLDEFFMVRVAGLKRRIATGLAVRSASGLEPRELFERLHAVSAELQERHARLYTDEIVPALEDEGIAIMSWDQLTYADRQRLTEWFDETVFPVLTPLAVDPAHPFPYISGLALNLAIVLVNLDTGNEHFARLKIPPLLPRLVRIESTEDDPYSDGFVPLEEVIAAHLDRLFPGMDVREHFTFRVTRNEDVEVEEDDAENLLTALEKELTRRRFGPAVRLEVEEGMTDHVMGLLTREMQIHPREVRRLPAPLDLTSLGAVFDLERTELKYPGFVPRTHGDLARVESSKAPKMFSAIRARDVLVQHPYDSFSTSVQAFVEQAAADPDVLAIRQTLYRTSGDSPIIDALIDAADAGKQVLAVVEIKARFDEQNNIDWARKLEHAGVHVVYGIVGLKTHCKLSQVVRRERGGLVRYTHIGTGNYHPKTARLYEDYGLFTRDETVAEDVTKLFNQLSGWAPATTFSRLLVAPRTVRSGLIKLIEEQIARAEEGKEAYVGIKVNAIVDEAVIDELYRASQAGVRVEVLVRGICALRPGVEGMSENISVRSVIGRFLEHSRVFCFGPRSERTAYIGSADMMHRNLDRRVEALVRLTDPRHIAQVSDLLELGMSEHTAYYHLREDGRWSRHYADSHGRPLVDMQAQLIAEHSTRRKQTRS